MNIINGKDFRRMVIAGANNLQKNRQIIDDLNVFPVPDGDTGSNMSMTLVTVAKGLKSCDSEVIEEVAKVASSGALRGARGNSGVITSQIFRGIYDGFKEKSEVNVVDFANALSKAKDSAYKAVMKPKEGTMLTIIRVMAEKAEEIKNKEKEIDGFLKQIIDYGNEVLLETPEMLPQLKEAGVVDSGGTGLIRIFEGMYTGLLSNKEEDINEVTEESSSKEAFANFNTDDILNAYCTEFLINKENYSKAKIETLHDFLKNAGDSLVLVDDEEIVKVHVHTNHPGNVLEKALEIGSFISVKIENMKQQHSTLIKEVKDTKKDVKETKDKKVEVKKEKKADEPRKNIGFIAVCAGDGMTDILTNLKVDYVISGGQTMNPSTEDFISAIDEVNADNIIIFPNNKNIIMAAEQSKELCKDKNIIVVKTTAVPESVSAMINYMEGMDVEELVSEMEETVKSVKTAEITYAVRDTKSNGKTIKKNDIIGIMDGEIKVIGKTPFEVAKGIIDELSKDSPDIITVYTGEDAKEEDNEKIEEYMSKKCPKTDAEIENGGQPLYYYIISAE